MNNIQQKNRQLLSRLIFMGIFGALVLGIFWLGQRLSNSEQDSQVLVSGEYEKGRAVLVEYSDFQCPACGMYYPVVKQLKVEFGDKLEVVYKHFPLQNIHKNSYLAARVSEAALIQGKFWEMHNILFEKQKEWAESGQALSLFAAYATDLGLNKEKFFEDIEKSSTYDKVNSDYQEGVRLKVNGTPTFFLNGKKIVNPKSYDEFKLLIQNEINR